MEPPKNDPQRGGSIVICLSAEVKVNTASVGMKASKSKPTNAPQAVKKVETSAEEVYRDEVPRTSEDRSAASSTTALDALCCETKADGQADTEAKDREPCNRMSPSGELRPFEPEGKTGINKGRTANDCECATWTTTKDGSDSISPVLQECSAHENGADKGKDPVKYLSGVEHGTESDEVVDGTSGNLAEHQSKEISSAELRLTSRASDVVREKSEIELDYDMVDPLEVARHVAIEVEKEAVDCREGSCSSSDGSPESVSQKPDNTASETESRTCVQEELSKEVPSKEKLSTINSELSQPASCSEKKADESVNVTQEIEYSQVTNVSREPADAGKNVWTFDLNEEVCLEMDGLEKQISTPIPFASALKETTAERQGAVFHFEGNLGWGGTTARRDFRAPSPCLVPEVDKGLSVGESSNSSKQRDDCRDIDLNNDDSLNEIMVDPLTGTHNRDPSGLPSGQSADAASHWKPEKLFLDLNCVTDDVDETPDWQAEGQLHLTNGHHNRSSSSSSSSSSKQHSFKNFDLNDQPSFGAEFSGHHNFIKRHQSYNTSVADDSVVSIMGMRVEVNKSMSNSSPFGRNPEPHRPLDANLARAAGLIGNGSAVPIYQSSLAMYGPGGRLPYLLDSKAAPDIPQMMGAAPALQPYLLDSKAAPAIPQMMGAALALQPALSQPHYMTSMTSMPISRGDGHAGVSLDLNSGLMTGGNRDNGGPTRQFLSTGKEHLMDDRLMSPPTGLVLGKRRREADSGWELEPYPFKHHQPT